MKKEELIKRIDNWKGRASSNSKLLTGTIGISKIQEEEINNLIEERDYGINANGNKVKWTDTKAGKLKKLIHKRDVDPLPKTLKTELIRMYRQIKHKRTFYMTNKYVQKGILEEEEGISIYQDYRNEVLGINTLFIKNEIRLYGEYTEGEPDLSDTNNVKDCNEGFDTKCSWELDTFPLENDKLDTNYEIQNQTYMDLTGTDKWTTAYVLVNASATHVIKETEKYFFAYGNPSDEDEMHDKYIEACREVEKRLIFDRARFESRYPFYDWHISKEEWEEEGYDIPLEDRVVEKVSYRNDKTIESIKNRVIFGRKFMLKIAKG